MSKTQTQIVKAPAIENLPAYLTDQPVIGIEELKSFVVLPRIKVIQKAAERATLDKFAVGDIVLVPQNILVATTDLQHNGKPEKQGESFLVVPIFFYPSWASLNPLELKGKSPFFLKYTTDATDPLVAKCKNRATWTEAHPDDPKLKIRNVEMLNFVVEIQKPELEGQLVVMTFMKAEWMQGSNWASLIKMSRRSIFARQWKCTSTYRPGSGNGDWYGIDVVQPDDPTQVWVPSQDRYEAYAKLNADLADMHKSKGLQADVSDGGDADPAAEPVDVSSTATY